jgi:hypothetical protein
LIFLSLSYFYSLVYDILVDSELLKSVYKLLFHLGKEGFFAKLVNNILLVRNLNYKLHQFVHFVVIICRQLDHLVPKKFHVGDFELKRKFHSLS